MLMMSRFSDEWEFIFVFDFFSSISMISHSLAMFSTSPLIAALFVCLGFKCMGVSTRVYENEKI